MIRYSLVCKSEHEFEAWFRNSDEFDKQSKKGQLECPLCGDSHVKKAIVAPAVARTDRETSRPTGEQRQQFFAAMRKHVEDNFEDVGDKFPEQARAMHDGDIEDRPIYGEASPEEAQELIEDGVPIAPMPDPIVPKKKRKRLN